MDDPHGNKIIVVTSDDMTVGGPGGDAFALMDTSNASSNQATASSKRKSCKPQGPEYEFFEILGSKHDGKGYRIRCKFCGKREMNSHAPRMRKHLVLKCEGNVPEEVKNRFRNHRSIYTPPSNQASVRKSNRKRTPVDFGSGASSEDDEDSGEEYSRKGQRAAEIISELITSQKRSEETTAGKKPLKQFTEADFDREHKELMTKKMRLEVRMMEDQTRFWAKMSSGIDKVFKAVDIYIESKSRETQDMPHVHTLYTNHDGSAVLEAAYAQTIQPNVTDA